MQASMDGFGEEFILHLDALHAADKDGCGEVGGTNHGVAHAREASVEIIRKRINETDLLELKQPPGESVPRRSGSDTK